MLDAAHVALGRLQTPPRHASVVWSHSLGRETAHASPSFEHGAPTAPLLAGDDDDKAALYRAADGWDQVPDTSICPFSELAMSHRSCAA